MALNLTSFDSALKEYYTSDRVENMVYDDNPFLAMVPKMERFLGKRLPIPIIYENPQGRSRDFAQAQTRGAATSSKLEDFQLTRAKDYGIATVDGETLEASEDNAGAFLEAAKTEIDGALNGLSNNVASSCFRDDAGEIGQVNVEPAEAADTVITLKAEGDITGFAVGMIVNIWSAKSGGTQRISSTGVTDFTLKAVNRSTGVITIDELYDTNGTIAADDFIFVKGDRGISISGLEAWIPLAEPTATLFFGVDRTVDPTRLAGIRDNTGINKPIEEALIDLSSKISREGGKSARPDYCFLSHKQYANLEKAMGAKVQYINLEMPNNLIGFKGIQISGSKGPITCIADRSAPEDRAYILTMSSWKLYSIKKAVRILEHDGLSYLRQTSADGIEIRCGSYSNLGCKAPGWNGVVSLAA